jgi:hypothetical protein
VQLADVLARMAALPDPDPRALPDRQISNRQIPNRQIMEQAR